MPEVQLLENLSRLLSVCARAICRCTLSAVVRLNKSAVNVWISHLQLTFPATGLYRPALFVDIDELFRSLHSFILCFARDNHVNQCVL